MLMLIFQIKNSQKFCRILELILLLGNILNTGSRNEQSVGFDISYLPKLENTRARDNKGTLMTFLVEIIEKNHPDLITFYVCLYHLTWYIPSYFQDHLPHVGKSSNISVDNIQKVIKQIQNSIRTLENDIKNFSDSNVTCPEKAEETLKTFLNEAKEEYSILHSMSSQLDGLYSDLSEYFVFDRQKYSLENFFGDIKQFMDKFQQVVVFVLQFIYVCFELLRPIRKY